MYYWFAAAHETSTVKLSAFFQHFMEQCVSRVKETKLTSGSVFIVDIFPLGDEKNQNMH